MPVPVISEAEIEQHVPGVKHVRFHKTGGQKRVFTCEIHGQAYVLKVVETDIPVRVNGTVDLSFPEPDAYIPRLKREIAIPRSPLSGH